MPVFVGRAPWAVQGDHAAARCGDLCGTGWDAVTYVPDRKSNDIRYAMDWTKIADDLGYRPAWPFDDGLAQSVAWYKENSFQWEPAERGEDVPMAEITVRPTAET
ncbi:hypothetical protein ABZS95_38425 [Streptomyces sp. NPDC005479]|uniref:hypothetical protein n=1 Tax=unclassified Streptomyces TaxID=2593676 RepID=UPI0033A798E1